MGSICEWATELLDKWVAGMSIAIETILGGVFAVCGALFAVLTLFTIFG